MKNYVTPTVEIMELKTADIITLSALDALAGSDDVASAPRHWF